MNNKEEIQNLNFSEEHRIGDYGVDQYNIMYYYSKEGWKPFSDAGVWKKKYETLKQEFVILKNKIQ